MKFDESGKLFVYVKQGYNSVGVLCFKLVNPDEKRYVIGMVNGCQGRRRQVQQEDWKEDCREQGG